MDAAERCVKSLGVVDILFVLLRYQVKSEGKKTQREFKKSLRENYTKEECY
jgi:hypothetical protein|tara:strand:+ start:377 stop:529 length:153 start_codon:yes stop_codon:yes gene_type:complete